MRIKTVAFAIFCCMPLHAQHPTRQLIQDPHFQNGFQLLEPKPGKLVVYGAITDAAATGKPAWQLGQWSSKYPLQPGVTTRQPEGFLCFTNIAKRVCIGEPGSPEADLSFAVNASVEYGGRTRKSQAEPWVHLLAQQNIVNPPPLADLTQCLFHIEARLKRSVLYRTNEYSPSLHAAQFQIYFIVANRNSNSAGNGQYYWFGVPFYDNRSRIVPSFQAKDFGGTDKFIYTPSSSVFAAESTHDGQWVAFNKDLLPLMRDGLHAGWKAGFMPGSTNLADYRITGAFMGWEVPGNFDVEMQVRNLSVLAVP